MYDPKLIELSKEYLFKIFQDKKDGMCLLGGWAVHDIVNENFLDENGRPYLGSRDIDVGFHISNRWGKAELQSCIFSKFLKDIKKIGFNWIGFRLKKEFDYETLEELTPEEAKKKSFFEKRIIFVDPIVDYIHPDFENVFNYLPIDEPILSNVFKNRWFFKNSAGMVVTDPPPLLAMKFSCVEDRNKFDKRQKDIMDIYAIIGYSDLDLNELKFKTSRLIEKIKIEKIIERFKEEELRNASRRLGVEKEEIKLVLNTFKTL